MVVTFITLLMLATGVVFLYGEGMYSCERSPVQEESPYEQLGRGSGYELTEEQKTALSDTAKVALGIASDALSQPVDSSKIITETLLALTQLQQEDLIAANKELLREGYTKLDVGLDDPRKVRLHLTTPGILFLQEQVGLVS